MKPIGNIDDTWITFFDAVRMEIGYRYKGDMLVDFSVAQTIKQICEDAGNYSYKKVSVKLKNPILRPFRKDDNEFEFGIHDVRDNRGVESVCGFVRFTESQLKNHYMFEKVEIKGFQEHELMLMEAMDKANGRNGRLFKELFSIK